MADIRKLYLVGEGHGEVQAALNLVTRLWDDLGLPRDVVWKQALRGTALQTEQGFQKICTLLRSKADCGGVLILRDEDDGCPAQRGPQAAGWLRNATLPFPSAVVLAHREYEALFLPCLHLMAGQPLVDPSGQRRPGLRCGARFEGDPETIRDVKGLLSQHYDGGRAYKPTLDQLSLTRWIDFPTLRQSQMPCFETLERALRFLASPGDELIYPPVLKGKPEQVGDVLVHARR